MVLVVALVVRARLVGRGGEEGRGRERSDRGKEGWEV